MKKTGSPSSHPKTSVQKPAWTDPTYQTFFVTSGVCATWTMSRTLQRVKGLKSWRHLFIHIQQMRGLAPQQRGHSFPAALPVHSQREPASDRPDLHPRHRFAEQWFRHPKTSNMGMHARFRGAISSWASFPNISRSTSPLITKVVARMFSRS